MRMPFIQNWPYHPKFLHLLIEFLPVYACVYDKQKLPEITGSQNRLFEALVQDRDLPRDEYFQSHQIATKASLDKPHIKAARLEFSHTFFSASYPAGG